MANSNLPQEMKIYFACDPNGYQLQHGAKKIKKSGKSIMYNVRNELVYIRVAKTDKFYKLHLLLPCTVLSAVMAVHTFL